MSLPLTIIGGYLGSGKTTLLNHLLRHADGLRLAVLVNDFGDLAIDADLIEAEDDQMISIAGGCVCCSFGDDLTQALLDLSKLDPLPDHVLLETSGVALPGAIAASLIFTPDFQHDSTIVLTNAETIRTQASDTYVGDTIQRQLKDADLIVLNKTDLVEPDAVPALVQWMTETHPQAQTLTAQNGQLPLAVLLQSFLGRHGREAQASTHQPDLFASASFTPVRATDAEKLAEYLASEKLGLVRAKGFVTDLSDTLMSIQVVGRRWAVTPAPKDAKPGLVVIGNRDSLNAEAITKFLDEA